MKRWRRAAALAALTLFAVFSNHASLQGQSASAQVKVTTNVIKKCTITSTDVAFGSYDPVGANSAAPLDGTGSVVVTCTRGTAVSIGIDNGQNAARRMNNGSGVYLTYQLYKDGGRTQIWSDNQPGAVGEPLVSIRHDGRIFAETVTTVRVLDCAWAETTAPRPAAQSTKKIRAVLRERYFTNTLRF